MALLRRYLTARCAALGLAHPRRAPARALLKQLTQAEDLAGVLAQAPDCFGERWGATDDDACKGCAAQALCLHRTAAHTLPRAQQQHQTCDAEVLARHMGLEANSLRGLQQAATLLGVLPPPNVAPPKAEDPAERQRAWPRRYLRERQRDPLLGRLEPGALLRRPFKGREYQVKVHDGFYELDGEMYPTLYAVCVAITGARQQLRPHGRYRQRMRNVCNTNARRFFWRAIEEALPGL